MLLTALFALNIGSIHSASNSSNNSVEYLIGLFLLISIGLCIDISKYLFWLYRKKHLLFLFLSIILACFSWAASVAFFYSKESANISQYQTETSQYIANNKTISLLELEVSEKRKLLKKRLSSSYHSQWDKGDELLEEINILVKKIDERIESSDNVGIEEAKSKLSTSALFSSIASALSIPASSVTNIIYGILSLIIEVCALGIMSLAQLASISSEKNKNNNIYGREVNIETKSNGRDYKRINAIRHDILSGNTEPLISKIIKKYSIQHSQAKKIMTGLEKDGKIMVKNNRYYLL